MFEPRLIIDFDSTFVTMESFDELAEVALAEHPDRASISRQFREITKQGMEGKIGFAQSLAQRIKMIQTNKQHIDRVIVLLRHHITPSVQRNLDFFQSHAEHIYIISGGFREYIVPIVADYNIAASHVLANHFTFASDGTVTGYDSSYPLAHDNGKVTQLADMHLERPVYIIGDGYTDYMVKAGGQAEKFWAFTENVLRQVVVDKADAVVDSFDQVISLLSS